MSSPPSKDTSDQNQDGPLAQTGRLLKSLIQQPAVVASIAPSSRFVLQKLAAIASDPQLRRVIELGPGTGGTTRALLSELPLTANLLAVEMVEEFVQHLRRIDDPRLIVHHGSATHLRSTLEQYQWPDVDLVVSGIPFSTLAEADARELIQVIHHVLRPGGQLLGYQVRDHISRYAEPYFGPPVTELELRNLPPLRIYRWKKPEKGNADEQ